MQFTNKDTYCFQDAIHAYSGGLDKVLKMYDFNTSTGNYLNGFTQVICTHQILIQKYNNREVI